MSYESHIRGGRSLPLAVICALVLFRAAPALAEGGAGGVLQGIAGIIQAGSPIGEAAAKAGAKVAVNAANAEAAVATTRIAAETSKFLSTNQTRVALEQIAAAERINSYNQKSVTDRLVAQLSELRAAREQQLALERERFEAERELNNYRIALAWQQQEANFKLAQMQLQAQLVQAGLSTGFTRQDSSSGITVTRLGAAGPTAFGFAPQAQPSRLIASLNTAGPSPFPNLNSALQAQQITESAGGSLLSSLSTNSLVRGSTASQPVRIAASPVQPSDLTSFQNTVPAAQPEVHVGRSRSSVLVGAQGHNPGNVSGRPVLGRPSGRPLVPSN